jgi:CBS domain containing-hemolysin-like protein
VNLALELVALGVLILLNAFFVAAEYGLVTARSTKIAELADEGNRRAHAVMGITARPPRFIAAMQLGVTLASLGIGAVGEPVLSHSLDDWLAGAVAIVIAFFVITFLHVVVGELVPKGVALSYSERTALAVATPVRGFFLLFRPLIWVLQVTTEGILRAMNMQVPGAERDVHSEAELRMLLNRSTEHGEIEQQEQEMVYKVFDFADQEVADVMVSRPEVVAISVDLPPEECLRAVTESPHTRYPAYRGSLDEIVGVLHVRDLFAALNSRPRSEIRIEELLRPAQVVPETKDLASLLADFRRTKQHLAVVKDEYGQVVGIVTLEDLLEEIVGEIEDEFDLPDESVEHVDETTIRIDGTFPIDEFNEEFHQDVPVEDYHTVAGFVFGQLGRAPETGDEVDYDGLRFRVVDVSGSRIERLEVEFRERVPATEPEAEAAAEG